MPPALLVTLFFRRRTEVIECVSGLLMFILQGRLVSFCIRQAFSKIRPALFGRVPGYLLLMKSLLGSI